MNIIYYQGSYYVQHDNYKAVFKVTPKQNEVTTIEVVELMPGYNYGTYVDPSDVIWQGVIDNLKLFISNL